MDYVRVDWFAVPWLRDVCVWHGEKRQRPLYAETTELQQAITVALQREVLKGLGVNVDLTNNYYYVCKAYEKIVEKTQNDKAPSTPVEAFMANAKVAIKAQAERIVSGAQKNQPGAPLVAGRGLGEPQSLSM